MAKNAAQQIVPEDELDVFTNVIGGVDGVWGFSVDLVKPDPNKDGKNFYAFMPRWITGSEWPLHHELGHQLGRQAPPLEAQVTHKGLGPRQGLGRRGNVQPFLILLVFPMGFVGVVVGHMVLGMTVTLLSLLGVVALAGVVVNDAIVFIDYFNKTLAKPFKWTYEGKLLQAA